MKDFFECTNNAPFDDFMLYPFFSSYKKADDIMTLLLGERVEIENVDHVEMDHVVGKMAGGIEILCQGEDKRFSVYIKRIEDDYSQEIINRIISFFGNLIEDRQKEENCFMPVVIFIDRISDCDPSVLVARAHLHNKSIGEMYFSYVYPDCKSNGPMKDLIHELSYGEKKEGSEIGEKINWILSQEGKEEYKEYWEEIDKRWQINLAGELFSLGMKPTEVRETMELSIKDTANAFFLSKLKEKVASMDFSNKLEIDSDHY